MYQLDKITLQFETDAYDNLTVIVKMAITGVFIDDKQSM